MINKQRKKEAKEFLKRWKDRGNEKADSQTFWLDLLQNVFGIENPGEYIEFEHSVSNMMDTTSFIDGYIKQTNVLIEQKSRNRDLGKGIKQSDGSILTPFQQAKRYSADLKYSQRPRWIVTSNFHQFYVYDMENPNSDPTVIELSDLADEYYRLEFLIDKSNTQIKRETDVSIQAGEIIGEIYNELIQQYNDPDSISAHKSINQICVRLVFCYYAEDAGLFGKRGKFSEYLSQFQIEYFRNGLIDLFDVLNTPYDERDPYITEILASFPYVNGGLFENSEIEIPRFTERLRELIIMHASSEFDWSKISPTIFGSVFESTLNPQQRRDGGMHYTSIQNIHRVIDPLFLNELQDELNNIRQIKTDKRRIDRARKFQDKLASLKFLDPACGSGNFITETYLALRELENQAFIIIYGDSQRLMIDDDFIKVSLNQFYGIEINDFAVSVAKTALWIAESQMFEKTLEILYIDKDFLPLKSYINIVEGNALHLDWNKVVDIRELNYIMGNPPFIGTKYQDSQQKKDLKEVHPDLKQLDYVTGWFYKASKYIQNTNIEVAFVSTNSITQGEQVYPLWSLLLNHLKIKINFAYKAFPWNSETKNKANVHCVIIGFSVTNRAQKIIFNKTQKELVKNISPYIINGPNILVKKSSKPLSPISIMTKGSQPTDGGNLILNQKEKDELIRKEPNSEKYIRKYMGAKNLLNNTTRYCLWLKDCPPGELRSMPLVMKRLEMVKQSRLNSSKLDTRNKASSPALFTEDRQPKSNYLMVPVVSSENRRYIPMGYMPPTVIANTNTQMIPDATLYEFGILQSNVHMTWVRTVAGRMESRYAYSTSIVYNNFPWPDPSKDDKEKVEMTAQKILEARNLYPNSSLADLYDELTMPVELRKAHQENDKAVMRAYNFSIKDTTGSEAAQELFQMYQKLLGTKK